jgi:hypothetical protein
MSKTSFIKVTTGNFLIVHGYDENNKEILEEIKVEKPMVKMVAIDRIRSITDKYILVTASHGRMMYWEYEESFEDIEKMLDLNGLLLNDTIDLPF